MPTYPTAGYFQWQQSGVPGHPRKTGNFPGFPRVQTRPRKQVCPSLAVEYGLTWFYNPLLRSAGTTYFANFQWIWIGSFTSLEPFKGFGWLDFAGKEPIEEVNYVNWSTIKNLRFPQFSPQFDWSKAQRVSGRDRSAGQLDPAFQLIRQGQGLICHELRTCGGCVILVIWK